jgi:FSR family fosmidomycin resistance protein-like MFS transporter
MATTVPTAPTASSAAAPPQQAPPAARHANVRMLALLTLAHVVVDTYATTVPSLLPFWQQRFALSYGLAGLITGIANVTSSVAQPLVGILTDRGRDPRWIAAACLVAATGVAATGLAPAFPIFLALVVTGGLGVSAFHPQGYKQVGQHAGHSQAAATSWFLVGGNVGVALGPLLGTAVVVHFGLGGTTLLLVPGLAFAALMWWLVPRWSRQAAAGAAARGPAARSDGAPGDVPAVAVLALRRRNVAIAVLVLIVAVRTIVSSSLISFVPLYFVRVAGADETVASRMLAGVLLAGAVATVAGGYLADRVGRMRVLALSLVPVPLLLIAFLRLPAGSPASTAALWLVGALITASFSITVVLAQELWYERRALASGLIVGSAFGVGGLLVPAVGSAADAWGLPAALHLLAVLPVLALALTGLLAAVLAPARQRPPA